jgi:serine/threonine-protein kinase
MGEVYRARDPRLGRDVAIKVLPERLSKDPQALARLQLEARAVAALSHPNILAIFDVGSHQGMTYVVTELLEGETLRSRLKRGALPWRAAFEIAAPLAEGLSVAHSKGIVHRDLKPENIFLTSAGLAKILDFGLARWRPANSSGDESSVPTETEPGIVMGTVGYMSPEQVRGRGAEAPSDIFSLGCVLYEMISGQRAFHRETAAQTMTAILEQQPEPLSESGNEVPPELDRVVTHCLEKNPEARFQSGRDLGFALRNLLSGTQGYRGPTVRRRFRLKPVLSIAAVVGALCAATFFRFTPTGNEPESIAILPFVNATGSPDADYLGDGITESLINSLSRVPNLAVISRNAVFRYKGRDTDAQAVGQVLKVRAVLTGSVVQRGDALSVSTELIDVRNNRHLWGEQYNRKLHDILAVQEEISREISQKLRLNLTGAEMHRLTKRYTESTEAYQLYLQGRYYWNKKTPAGFNTGIDYFQKAIQVDPNYAPAYAALSNLYYNLSNYNFALMQPKVGWFKAKEAAEKAIQIDDALPSAHASLALIAYQWEWDWPKAEREFKRALELDPGSSSTYEPTPSSTYHWYSHFLMTVGRTEESFAAGKRALELDPVDLAISSHQGWYYLWTGDHAKAIQPLQNTIAMDPNFSVAQWYIGLAYEEKGAYPDAIAQFQNCVRLTAGRPSMLALLGHAYAAGGQPNEAHSILQQLRSLEKDKYVPSYPLAVIHAALGEKDKALTRLEKAYEDRDSWMDYLAIDPRLDSLRSEPRLAALLRRMNLAP